MKCRDPLSVKNTIKRRLIIWDYEFPKDDENIVICKKFLSDVIRVGYKRLDTIQRKILLKLDLGDNRGKHDSKIVKLTNDIKDLIKIHCESLPHRKSHYKRESTSLNYFKNSELNLKKLYDLFIDFSQSVLQEEYIAIEQTTYNTYFNRNLPFTFKLPRTDVCNDCYESENKSVVSPEIIEHKKNAKEYLALKKEFLSEKNALCCEFDYAQNLPLPKIPVSDQFYRRLLWLYLFNVHIHNSDKSYMYPYLEGIAKKGANTVCSFLHHSIQREFDPLVNSKIILFSDAASGQNRNYTVLTFLTMLSIELNVEIWHVFPVRGHSYCQCDRNFGTYAQKKKKMERIETAQIYIDLIRNARDPPFTVIQSTEDLLRDFDLLFKGNLQKPKGLKISEARVIHYYPIGQIDAFNNYLGENPSTYHVHPKLKLGDLQSLPPPQVGITSAKMKDIKSLMSYLSEEGKIFYNEYFAKINVKKTVAKKASQVIIQYSSDDASSDED